MNDLPPYKEWPVNNVLPYDQWPDDPYRRKYQAEHALGQALMANLEGQRQFIKGRFAALAPALSETELEALVTEAAFSGIYSFLMVLDGVAGTEIDANHGIEWEVQARILKWGIQPSAVQVPTEASGNVTLNSFRPAGTECVETVNLASNGDGLCYASHGWKENYVNQTQPGTEG